MIINALQDNAAEAVKSMHAIQQATDTGRAASQQTSQSLSSITADIDAISDMNVQVATATEEQSSVTDDVTKNVQGIADLARATLSEVQACRDDCRTLGKLAENLGDQMSRFKF